MSEGEDARFADGDPAQRARLRLRALEAEDLAVISALAQDAVGKTTEIAWMPQRRMFAMMLNRFRWEDAAQAEAEGREFERVRCGLHVENVQTARFTGFHPKHGQEAFELLALRFEPGEDAAGTLYVDCAGGAGFALQVEALEVCMSDLDALWKTRAAPDHSDGDAPA